MFWQFFAERFGVSNLVPVALAGNETASTLPEGVIGKVPSVYNSNGEIVGFKNWQQCRATNNDYKRWSNDPRYGFGVILGQPLPNLDGAVAVCIDVDTENYGYQMLVANLIREAVGMKLIPMRVRENSNRRAYVLAVMPPEGEQITKRVLRLGKTEAGKPEAVEILGYGQQFVAGGRHPSGARLEWLNGPADDLRSDLCLPDPAELLLTWAKFEALIDRIAAELPVEQDTKSAARRARLAATGDAPDDEVAQFLDENGYTLDIGPEGERHMRSPFADEYTKEQGEGDTSVTYFLKGTRGYEQGHFVSLHASDAHRNDSDFLEAIGFVASQFEALPMEQEEASISVYNGIGDAGKLLDPQGRTGCNHDDKKRAMFSQAFNVPLGLIPPKINLKYDRKGVLIAYQALNHSDNLRWSIEKRGKKLLLNSMTWQSEFLNADNSPFTHSDVETFSELANMIAEDGLPAELAKSHFEALAGRFRYHPVKKLLHGRTWDGVKRVDRVLACLNAKRPVYAAKIIRLTLTAAIAAIEEGQISMKAVPVLFSTANDWYKSAFVKRLFGILPGAHCGALSVDPRNKDSVRKAVFCWGGELGELDFMTKQESGPLKAWIPESVDIWRAEHKAFFTKKPRQTVFIGTVNKEDFCKDPTLASRFPVIELARAIDIDKVNEILGWQLRGDDAELVDAEQLAQFWLEVREEYKAGARYTVDSKLLKELLEISEDFTDKGPYYGRLREIIDAAPTDKDSWPWRRVGEICGQIGVNIERSGHIGRALRQLVSEAAVEGKRIHGAAYYRFPDSVDEFNGVTADERIAQVAANDDFVALAN